MAAITGGVYPILASFVAPNYNFSVVSIPDGVGSFTNTGSYPYNTGLSTEWSNNDAYNYTFQGWSWTTNPANIEHHNPSYAFTLTRDTTLYAFFSYIAHDVTVNVESNNSTLGTVKINYGGEDRGTSYDVTELQDFTLIATPQGTNSRFSAWYLVDGENEQFVSEDASYTTQLPEFSSERTYRAKFVSSSDHIFNCTVYTINEGGAISGAATGLAYNTPVTIHAGTLGDYTFVGWYEDLNGDSEYTNDERVSTDEDYTFYITRNRTLGAMYRHNDLTVTVTNDPIMGTISTEESFTVEYNAPVTIVATPNAGYRFNGWTGTVSGADASLYIDHVTQNLDLTANYMQTFEFNATAGVGGSVAVTPGNGTLDIHTKVSVTATPDNDNYMFSHWTVNGVDGNTDNPFTVDDLEQDYTLVANFVPTHSLELSSSTSSANAVLSITNNTTSWSGTYDPTATYKFADGDNITVTVESFDDVHWGYVCWKNAGSTDCFTENVSEYSYTFTLDGDKSLQASFTNLTVTHPVTVSVSPANAGSVSIANVTLVENQATVTEGFTTTLTANNETGYRFDYWMINGIRFNDNPQSYTFTAETEVVAHFREASQLNVNVVVHPAGAGSVSPFEGTHVFTDGDNITLTATPGSNYSFWGWIINSEPVGAMGQTTLTIQELSEDITVHAWFYTPEIEGSMDFLTYNADSTVVTGVKEGYRTRITSVNIPVTTQGVHTIAANAFAGCTSLESLFIAPTVTTIEQYAFSNCTALTTVDIPTTVNTIANDAFYGCTSLQTIVLPEELEQIADELFYNCTSLGSLEIPAGVTSIGARAFNGCSNLYAIEIPASVTTVGNQAFMGCSSLRNVTVNGGVTSFGEDAFSGCTSIAQVFYNGEFAQWFDIEFANAKANPAARTRDLMVNGEQVTKLVIPEGVTEVKEYAFYLNTHIDTIVIPATVTSIDSVAFYRLTNLKRIVLGGNPDDITVHTDAFSNVNKDNVVVEVPCDYTSLTEWNGFTHIVGQGIPVLTIVQRPGGTVTVTATPDCGDDNYVYSVSAQATGIYSFISWSDGVLSPSRDITLTEDMTLSAIFDRNTAAEGIVDYSYYFDQSIDAQEWFSITDGDNEWTVGNAVAKLGNGSLYVSRDGGATCSYNAGNSPYTYTEIKLHDGIYRFSLNYLVGDDPDDNLTIALMPIPANEDDEAYANLDPYAEELPMLIDGLTGNGDWDDAYRLFQIPAEGWYRLVFFWNVNSDDENVADIAAAVDNITFNWMDPKPSELNGLHADVSVTSDDFDMGNAYTWNEDEEYIHFNGMTFPITDRTTTVEISRSYNFAYTEQIWIHAVPEEGYRFVRWSDGETDADRQLNFLSIYGLHPTYTAYFEPIPVQWTVNVLLEDGAVENETPASSEYGIVYQLGTAEFGSIEYPVTEIRNTATYDIDGEPSVTVVLNQPLKGWAFMGWANENGDTVSRVNPYTFVYSDYNRDVTLTALMTKLTPCSYNDFDFENFRFRDEFRFRGRDLEDITVSNIEVTVRNGQIIVSEANGIEVSLYDVNGRLLESKVENAQNVYFEVPVSGTYMLKVGDLLTRRVVVVR